MAKKIELGTAALVEAAPEIVPVSASPTFNFEIVVFNPFQNYKRGDLINQAADIQAVIDNGFLDNCIKRAVL